MIINTILIELSYKGFFATVYCGGSNLNALVYSARWTSFFPVALATALFNSVV